MPESLTPNIAPIPTALDPAVLRGLDFPQRPIRSTEIKTEPSGSADKEPPQTFGSAFERGEFHDSPDAAITLTPKYEDTRFDFLGKSGGAESARGGFIGNFNANAQINIGSALKRWSSYSRDLGFEENVDEGAFRQIVLDRNIEYRPMTAREAKWAAYQYDGEVYAGVLEKNGQKNWAGAIAGGVFGGIYDSINIGVTVVTGGLGVALGPVAATAAQSARWWGKPLEIALATGAHSRTVAGVAGRATTEFMATVPLELHVREKYGETYTPTDMAVDAFVSALFVTGQIGVKVLRESRANYNKAHRDELKREATLSADEQIAAAASGRNYFETGDSDIVTPADIGASSVAIVEASSKPMSGGKKMVVQPTLEGVGARNERLLTEYKAGGQPDATGKSFISNQINSQIVQSIYNIGKYGDRNEARRLVTLLRKTGAIGPGRAANAADAFLAEFQGFAERIDSRFPDQQVIDVDGLGENPLGWIDRALKRERTETRALQTTSITTNLADEFPAIENPVQQIEARTATAISDDAARFVKEQTPTEKAAKPVSPKADVLAGPTGKTVTAFGPSNEEFEFRYRVVEVKQPVTSNNNDFTVNEQYDADLQPRDREERVDLKTQVSNIANDMNATKLLHDTRQIQSGIPIVDSDGTAINNGRIMGARILADTNPVEYRRRYVEPLLNEYADLYGIKREDIEKLESPSLVRELVTKIDDRAEFARKTNEGEQAKMSEFESAGSTAKRVSDDDVAGITLAQNAGQGKTAVQEIGRVILNALPINERAGLTDAGGLLNPAGVRLAEAVLFSKTYPGPQGKLLLENFIDTADMELKGLGNALINSIPAVAKIEAMIRVGTLDKGYALAADIEAAAGKMLSLRKEGVGVPEYFSQTNLFGDRGLTAEQEIFLKLLDDGRKSAGRLAEIFHNYALQVTPTRQGGLFDAAPSKTDVLNLVLREQAERGAAIGEGATKAMEALLELEKAAGNNTELLDILKQSKQLMADFPNRVKGCKF